MNDLMFVDMYIIVYQYPVCTSFARFEDLLLVRTVPGRLGALFATVKPAPLDLGWSLSLTRWLAVLLLFVLARVFEHGARMREELDGTV